MIKRILIYTLFPLHIIIFVILIIVEFLYYFIFCIPISAWHAFFKKLELELKYLEEYHDMLKDISPYRMYIIFNPDK